MKNEKILVGLLIVSLSMFCSCEKGAEVSGSLDANKESKTIITDELDGFRKSGGEILCVENAYFNSDNCSCSNIEQYGDASGEGNISSLDSKTLLKLINANDLNRDGQLSADELFGVHSEEQAIIKNAALLYGGGKHSNRLTCDDLTCIQYYVLGLICN